MISVCMKKTTRKSTLLLIIVIFFWYAQYVYIPYQNSYLASINVSFNMIGMVVGAYGISQFLLRFPMGILADIKHQHKFFILLGCALTSLASLVRIVIPNGIGFLVGNIISGFASATWISFMVLFVSFYPKSQSSSATCKIIMANNLGMFFAFVTSTLLFAKLGMLIICMLSVLSGLIGLILATQLHYPQHIHITKVSLSLFISVFYNIKLLFYALLALIQQGIQLSTTMSFTNQIIEDLGVNSTYIGVSSIIYMLSAVSFAHLGTSQWRKRLSISWWIILSFLLLALYCFLIPLVQSLAMIFVLQIIPGMATGILFSFLTSEAMSHVSQDVRSTAMGLFQAIYAIGMTLFPIIVGYLSHLFTLLIAYYVLGFIALLGLMLFVLFHNKVN